MKAEALIFRKARCPEIGEITIPTLGENEILMQTEYSGVSIGTETSIITGQRTHNGTFPLVPGYMASGHVLETGRNVSTFKAGDRVCGIGARFDTGSGIVSVWGGHSSYQILNIDNTFRIPDSADMKHAALFILPAVGLNAISMAGIDEHDIVLISGLGLIGYFFADWCRLRGSRVIAIEPARDRAAIALKNITPHVFSPEDAELGKKIADACCGRGISAVAEVTASKKLIKNATSYLSPGAKMIFLSWYDGNIEIDYSHFHNNSVTAFFPTGSGNRETMEAVLNYFAAGMGGMNDVIKDNTVPFREAPAAYDRILGGDRSIYGMVLKWK